MTPELTARVAKAADFWRRFYRTRVTNDIPLEAEYRGRAHVYGLMADILSNEAQVHAWLEHTGQAQSKIEGRPR